ncbi:MAG: extracellular solute-binding protein [Oscillospiraceae bacterium]|nr:extracellular solute-binding protein [Oscillospiraceae bacterium]
MKKFLLFLCCALFILFHVALNSCGKDSGGGEENLSFSQNTEEKTDEIQEIAAEVKILPDIPDNLDFDGYKFRIFYRSAADGDEYWAVHDIYSEAENGDAINDAVYNRNRYIEDKYNCEITAIPSTSTSAQASGVKKVVAAGSDEYDVIFTKASYVPGIITANCVLDLNKIPYLDFEKPWWDKSIMNQLSIMNKSYAAYGDILATNYNTFRVIMFNKVLIAEYELENPYDMVRNNTWTIDNFYNMFRNASKDINGDGVMNEKDLYGFLIQKGASMAFYYSADEPIIKKDENDLPLLYAGGERSLQVMEKISEIWSAKGSVMFDSDYSHLSVGFTAQILQQTFEDNRGLFYGEVLDLVAYMRSAEVALGIIPMPKLDGNQKDYISYGDGWCTNLILIPVTNSNPERTGAILEAMAAESKYTLLPAYYDKTLKSKYARDDESEEMLDIIFKTKIISIDELYGWGMHSTIQGSLENGKKDFVSAIEKGTARVEKNIDKTISIMESLN